MNVNTLELRLRKEPVLTPWDPIRHKTRTLLSSEVTKSWGSSGLVGALLSRLQTLPSFLLQTTNLHLHTNPSELLDFSLQPENKHPTCSPIWKIVCFPNQSQLACWDFLCCQEVFNWHALKIWGLSHSVPILSFSPFFFVVVFSKS